MKFGRSPKDERTQEHSPEPPDTEPSFAFKLRDGLREGEHIRALLLDPCPRCGVSFPMSDLRCGVCGMLGDEHGPAPIRQGIPTGIIVGD